jgi:hypothetical protein
VHVKWSAFSQFNQFKKGEWKWDKRVSLMNMKMVIFWNEAQCSLVDTDWHLRGAAAGGSKLLKRQSVSARHHGATFQETVVFKGERSLRKCTFRWRVENCVMSLQWILLSAELFVYENSSSLCCCSGHKRKYQFQVSCL